MTAMNRYRQLIREKITADFRGMYREPGEKIPHPFITPGSQQYGDVLWDWDSWLAGSCWRCGTVRSVVA